MRLVLLVLLAACTGSEPPPPPPTVAPPPPPPPKPAADTGGPAGPNRPPQVTAIRFDPPGPTTMDAIRAVVEAKDPDGDRVDVDYAWFVNGRERYDLRAQVLPARAFHKGDTVQVQITVDDGTARSVRESKELVIANATPRFITDPRALRDLDGFRVEAVDDDEDKLTYALQGAPEGMSIDPDIGVLRYEGTADEPGGAYKITVLAKDPDGAKAGWTFGIELSPGSAAAKKAKEAEKTEKGR